MKKVIKICTVFMTVVSIFIGSTFCYSIPTYAADSCKSVIEEFFSNKIDHTKEFYKERIGLLWNNFLKGVGFVAEPSVDFFVKIVKAIRNVVPDFPEDADEEEVRNFIINNTTFNKDSGNIEFNSTMVSVLKDYINADIESNKYYTAYSVDISYYEESDVYLEITNKIKEYQNDYYCFMACWFGSYPCIQLVCIPKDFAYAYYGGEINENIKDGDFFKLNFINPKTMLSPRTDERLKWFRYELNTNTFNNDWKYADGLSSCQATRYLKKFRRNTANIYFSNNMINSMYLATFVTYGKNDILTVFGTSEMLQSIYDKGVLPYYFTDAYDSFNTTTGSYNTTTTNIDNSISYGDVLNYTTNNNPNLEDIFKFIKQWQPPTSPDGPGGSGGSGSGSGGSGSGIDVDLSWLGAIGKIIGELISGIGNALVGVVQGIKDLIVSVIDLVPSVFGDFMGAVLGWLPEELRLLITLSVVAMVTFGIIKMIRG